MNFKMGNYSPVFEKTSTGFSAYIPNLLGCVASGRNIEEVRKNIYEAIVFHLEGMLEQNQ